MKSIAIVCIGNICRSPMAAGIFSANLPYMRIRSAGIGAVVGAHADAIAIELMRDRGIDISDHIACQLNLEICQSSDLILVMDKDQKIYIESRYPATRGKVYRIAENESLDIPDPYKKPKQVFENSLELIESASASWIARIKKITALEQRNK